MPFSQDVETVLGEGFHYPEIDLASLHLPIIYREMTNKSLFLQLGFVGMIAFLCFIGICKLMLTFFRDVAFQGFLIVTLMFLAIFVSCVGFIYQKIARLKQPILLKIEQNRISFIEDNLSKNLTTLAYQQIYFANCHFQSLEHSVNYRIQLYFIELSEDNTAYKKRMIQLPLMDGLNYPKTDEPIRITAIIKTLLEKYHTDNHLTNSLPKIHEIKQKL